MRGRSRRSTGGAMTLAMALGLQLLSPAGSWAQEHQHDAGAVPSDSMPRMPGMPGMAGHDMSAMAGAEHQRHGGTEMAAMYGPYPMTREASGTSWQPDRARHRGIHVMKGSWMVLVHGFADVIDDEQGGPRGGSKTFAANMLMAMAQRPAGPGRLGLRAMLSLEPAAVGKRGYPLLLQTGETADGVTRLIDRQHPHDLFMELAGTYSVSRGTHSFFLYGGLPGEPALGPPAFMHRFSGMAFPLAPISHHWLDSSHITFGVITAGVVADGLKLEASAFRGREPDQDRWGIETPKLDSHAFRLSANPAPAWSLQVSRGRLRSPEALEPGVDVDRTTASVIWAGGDEETHREATLAWGRNRARPGRTLDALSLEGAIESHDRHTIFARAERVEKDELFPEGDPRDGVPHAVSQATVGYRYDFLRREHGAVGVGATGSLSFVPESIRGVYGDPPTAGTIFLHAEIR